MSAIKPPPTDRITQDELVRCRDAGERSRDAAVVHEVARKEVLRKLDEGLPVEPGPLRPSVAIREEKRITNAEIARLMGAEVLEELRSQVRPTVSRSLKIEAGAEAGSGDGETAPATDAGAAPGRSKGRRGGAAAVAFVLLLAAAPALALGQTPEGRNEVVTTDPRLGAVVAAAPIPADLHVGNEGGSDGAGLCVIASILANGRFQGVPGLEAGKGSALWREAKAAPGGYYPEKLEKLLKKVLPDEKWFSWEGDGADLVQAYSARGYPIGATMNTAELYDWQGIHHMVSAVHADDALACYVDNNDPGKFHWITAAEFARRFPDGGKGWGFVWLRRRVEADVLTLVAAAVLLGSAVVLFLSSAFHLTAARRLSRASA